MEEPLSQKPPAWTPPADDRDGEQPAGPNPTLVPREDHADPRAPEKSLWPLLLTIAVMLAVMMFVAGKSFTAAVVVLVLCLGMGWLIDRRRWTLFLEERGIYFRRQERDAARRERTTDARRRAEELARQRTEEFAQVERSIEDLDAEIERLEKLRKLRELRLELGLKPPGADE